MSDIIWPVKQMEEDWLGSGSNKRMPAPTFEIVTKFTPENRYEITISHMDRETFLRVKGYLDNRFFARR